MDFQRLMLIGAIAVLSLMLLVEWSSFEKEQRSASVQESSRSVLSENGPSSDSELPSDIPDISSQELPVSSSDDLPQAPQQASASEGPAIVKNDALGNRLIQIETDVLKFVVDLEGGDIIELSLPKFLEEQGRDAPFVLLEQNDQLLYIARSGLIGPDGIDKESRAQFSSVSGNYKLGENDESLVVDLTLNNSPNVSIIKRFTLRRSDYLVDIEYLVENNSPQRWQANLFGQIKRGSAPPPSQDTAAMGMQPFLGVATTQPDDRFTKFTFDDLQEESFKLKNAGG